jgi:NADH-quinone oxidoreductase subunit M
MPDLSLGERLALVPVIGLMFVLGLYPQLIVGAMNSTVMQILSQVRF